MLVRWGRLRIQIGAHLQRLNEKEDLHVVKPQKSIRAIHVTVKLVGKNGEVVIEKIKRECS